MKKQIRRTVLLLAATMLALIVGAHLNSPTSDPSSKLINTASAATNCCSGAHNIVTKTSGSGFYLIETPNTKCIYDDGTVGYGVLYEWAYNQTTIWYCTKCGKEISRSTSVVRTGQAFFREYWWSPKPLGTMNGATSIRG